MPPQIRSSRAPRKSNGRCRPFLRKMRTIVTVHSEPCPADHAELLTPQRLSDIGEPVPDRWRLATRAEASTLTKRREPRN